MRDGGYFRGVGLLRTHAGSGRRQPARGDKYSAGGRKPTQSAIAVERTASDASKDHDAVAVMSERQGSVTGLADIAQRIVVEEVDVETGAEDPRHEAGAFRVSQGLEQIDAAESELCVRVAGRKINGDIADGASLPQQEA